MKEFELTQHRMVKHYQECTGLDEENIRKNLLPPHDVWLTAEDALRLRICDSISILQR
jgi:ATP-dependent protease ClpP protease subunit